MGAELTIRDNDSVLSNYSAEQLEVIRNNVATPDFSTQELAYCLSVARARGLDPLKKQVYFSKRKKRDNQGNFVDAVTVEPTIDGFRSMAEETNELDGYDGPYWCGEDGVWKEVWLSSTPPAAAKITVYRKGRSHGYTSIARYSAYVQPGKDGKANHIWGKMGDNQLAKCAEALSLRKAFPQQCGAFYTREEMGQADAVADKFAALREHVAQDSAPVKLVKEVLGEKKSEGLPALPEVIDVPPAAILLAYSQLQHLGGVKLVDMPTEDLELLVETLGNGYKQRQAKGNTSELGMSWFRAIISQATLLLNERESK